MDNVVFYGFVDLWFRSSLLVFLEVVPIKGTPRLYISV